MTTATTQEIVKTQKKILDEIREIKTRIGIPRYTSPRGEAEKLSEQDEKIWKDIEPIVRKVRGGLFRESYPTLEHVRKKK